MLQKGYLNDIQNAILISVENDDAMEREILQDKISAMINSVLQSNQYDAAVLSQAMSNNDQMRQLANQYNISEGKASLIQIYKIYQAKTGEHS